MDEEGIGERLGAGKEAEVFAFGGGVLKLYRRPASKPAAFREAAILAAVEGTGLPVPSVVSVGRFAGRWGLAMTRAGGPSFADAMTADPAGVPGYLAAMAALQARIHAAPGSALPDLEARLAEDLERAPRLGAAVRRRLLAGLAAMPAGDRLCHGDFHPWNILGPPSSPIVVDWLDARRGSPAADLCRSWVLMRRSMPEAADAYLAAYARIAAVDPSDALAWLPFVAGARLAEGMEAEVPSLLALAEGRRP